MHTCELILWDDGKTEARILEDGGLLVSRGFREDWQAIQWADEQRKSFENGGA
jgi:hypothetical protein